MTGLRSSLEPTEALNQIRGDLWVAALSSEFRVQYENQAYDAKKKAVLKHGLST